MKGTRLSFPSSLRLVSLGRIEGEQDGRSAITVNNADTTVLTNQLHEQAIKHKTTNFICQSQIPSIFFELDHFVVGVEFVGLVLTS